MIQFLRLALLSFQIVLITSTILTAQGPELVVQSGHSAVINDIEYSPDGKYIATCSDDNTVKIWEIATGKEMTTLYEHTKPVNDIAFSPDSKQLVSVSDDRKVIIWDLVKGVPDKIIKEHKNKVLCVDYSPNGEFFATGGKDKVIRLHDVVKGKSSELYAFKSEINKLKFFDNGAYLYSETDRLLSKNAFFSIPKGKMEAWVPGGGATSVDFDSENQKFLAGRVSYGAAMINIIKDWREIQDWRKNKEPLWKSLYPYDFQDTTGDYRLLKKKENYDVKNVDSDADGSSSYLGRISAFFSKDGKDDIVAGNQFGELLFWKYDDVKFFPRTVNPYAKLNQKIGNMYATPYKAIKAHNASIQDATSSKDGKYILTSAINGEMKLWDVALERKVQTFTTKAVLPVYAVAFSSDSKTMIVSTGIKDRYIVDLSTMQVKDYFEYQYPIERFTYSDDQQLALLSYYNSSFFYLWDMTTKTTIRSFKGHLGEITSLVFSEDQKYAISTATEGKKITWDLSTGEIVKNESSTIKVYSSIVHSSSLNKKGAGVVLNSALGSFPLQHQNKTNSYGYTPDNRFVYTASMDGAISLWNPKSGKNIMRIMITTDKEVIAMTSDFYFLASKSALKGIAFKYEGKMYPFEQFDFQFNRPDIVLERLGISDKRLIKAYQYAYKKRKIQEGVTVEKSVLDFNAPTLSLDLVDIPRSSEKRKLSFQVHGEDKKKSLQSIALKINGVPIKKVIVTGQKIDQQIDVELGEGSNKVQVTLQNEVGVNSLSQTFEVLFSPKLPVKKDLYVITIGVSNYQDTNFNLTYANKDAKDLQQLFGKQQKRFENIHQISLLDNHATNENIKAIKQKLSKVSIDDHIILFFAGHGLLNKELDYFLATHAVNFDSPTTTALSFDDLQSLVSDIPSRHKLIMIDACHSGELEKKAVEVVRNGTKISNAKLTSRGYTQVRAKVGLSELIGFNSMFKFMKSVFADLRENTGTIVISSAGGEEYALESAEWKNGVFTFFVKEGIISQKADLDQNGEIYASELQKYLGKKVYEATGGRQRPTSRVENLSYDFRIW